MKNSWKSKRLMLEIHKIFTDKSKINFETSHNTEFLGYDKNNLQSEVLDIYYNDEKITSATKVGDEYLVILS